MNPEKHVENTMAAVKKWQDEHKKAEARTVAWRHGLPRGCHAGQLSGRQPHGSSVPYRSQQAARMARQCRRVVQQAATTLRGPRLGEVGEYRGHVASQQQVLRLPLLFGFQLLQKPHFAARQQRYGYSIPIEHAVGAQRG